MPYCRQCERLFEAEIATCPYCGVKLIDVTKEKEPEEREIDPEEEENLDETESVLLLKTDDFLQAQFLVGILEEEGIPYWAKRLGISGRLGQPFAGAITHDFILGHKPVEIYVSPGDFEQAQKLLEQLGKSGELLEEDFPEDEEE